MERWSWMHFVDTVSNIYHINNPENFGIVQGDIEFANTQIWLTKQKSRATFTRAGERRVIWANWRG